MVGTIAAVVATALIVVGSFFLLVGTVGLLRLPDVYNRMHATSKATTLGAASMFLACAVFFGPQGESLTAVVGIVFLFLTAPTGAHMISRSAQKMGVEFAGGATWPGATDSTPEAPADADPEGSDAESAD
ncbi:monovalent cation/H(+) antiporter subunit G [Halomarina litorea]|uniref:monovalent cation/H(+) antiporter subunit G n=1 Tax=Halomarina litorea TaxID=2961595 RepID=UPI0020C1E98D|nr:monovalent cation/H(+) antiporter subunit G [Halomarina sp. BCD28]